MLSDERFKDYLSSHILQSELAQSMDGKAAYSIRQLIKAYLTNPQQLPDAAIVRAVNMLQVTDSQNIIDISKTNATVPLIIQH
jgi:dGTP triphosphohydrolase